MTQENESALAVVDDSQLAAIAPEAIGSIQRAEIDVQISTARRYPRSLADFKKRGVGMATMDEETAASCIYHRPVGGGKVAEGLSIRMAEIVASCYGNLRFGAQIIEMTERYVKVRGFAHDLETNVLSAVEVIEPTVKKPRPGQAQGDPYDERMRLVIAKAALAKAQRDAIFKVVPRAICRPIEAAVKQVIAGNAVTLDKRRADIAAWIKTLNIDQNRVFAVLGPNVKGFADVTLDHIYVLVGLATSIKDGEVGVDEAFPKVLTAANVGNGGTITEQAAAERKSTSPAQSPDAGTVVEEPQPAEGPSADSLLKSLYAKGASVDCGKDRLRKTLIALRIIEPSQTLEKLDAKKLASILEGWEAVEESLK